MKVVECTREACSFRDQYDKFMKAGAMVIGVNSGTVESHKKFIQNHNLPFTLLSDPDNKVLKMFGVKSKFFITGRETFIVDLSGKIVFTFDSFTNGPAHEKEALQFYKQHAETGRMRCRLIRTFRNAKIPVKMDHQGNCYRPVVDRIQDRKQILFLIRRLTPYWL